MNKISFYILFLLFTVNSSFAQRLLSGNLVINPSFEFYTQCPSNYGELEFAYPWTSGGVYSSEYINLCSTNYYILQFFNYQLPRTGNGMAHICVFDYGTWGDYNYREYLMGVLSKSLIKNKRYCGEMYTSLMSMFSAIENIGFYFTNDTTLLLANNQFNVQPQIENHKGILMDTVNWMKINGSFIANGDEKFFFIGNFKDDSHTNYVLYDNPPFDWASYLFDDVSVCECSFDINLGADTTLCEGESLILNPMLPNATYTWQDSSHAATYEVKQPGTYWVRAYVADYDITSTDTIVITGGDDNFCNPPLTIPNAITPNGDSQNDNFVIQNAATYEIALQIYNRWGNIIYESSNYQNDFSCKDCADGTYFYILKAKSKRNGREKEYKGSLTVIK